MSKFWKLVGGSALLAGGTILAIKGAKYIVETVAEAIEEANSSPVIKLTIVHRTADDIKEVVEEAVDAVTTS